MLFFADNLNWVTTCLVNLENTAVGTAVWEMLEELTKSPGSVGGENLVRENCLLLTSHFQQILVDGCGPPCVVCCKDSAAY